MNNKPQLLRSDEIVMSARDEFAAAAMNGMLGSADPDTEVSFEVLAVMAYEMADAMMEARSSTASRAVNKEA